MLPLGDMVISKSGLLMRDIFGSMILPQLDSELMFMAHGTTKVLMDARDLHHSLWLCGYPRAMLPLVPCRSEWPAFLSGIMVLSGYSLWPCLCPSSN